MPPSVASHLSPRAPLVDKWRHYYPVYDRHLAPFVGRPVVMVEIGVYHGGSLRLFRDFLGPQARIVGVDNNPRCATLAGEGIEIRIGSQEDRHFLRALADSLPPIDILIDDGGHTMRQQRVTFEELFPRIAPDGVYLCEDLHTAYWPEYGGGYRRMGSFIEYAKGWVDQLHGWHGRGGAPQVTEFTRTVRGVHFYDSLVVVEKGPISAPERQIIGTPSFPPDSPPQHGWPRRLLGTGRLRLNQALARLRLPGV